MPQKAKSRKGLGGGSRDLLEDPDVQRWYENLRRGSAQTARERLRVLARLGRHLQATPAELVALAENGNGAELEDRLMDFLEAQLQAGRAPSYLGNYLKALRSWLEHHGLRLRRRVKVGDVQATPTLEEERVPTREELRATLSLASPRGKAVVSLMAFAGLRPGVLGSFRGTDGLRLRDLEDLDLTRGPRFLRSPARVRVRPELSKASHAYLSFLGAEGQEHIRRYLESRADGGETLTPESPVVRCAPGFETQGKREGARNRGSPFIGTTKVRSDVKSAMKKAGYDARPYVLRRYFETQLLNASWKGLVPRDWVTFWSGHKGDIEHVYVLNKGLPAGLVEEMRAAYGKAEPALSTVSLTPEGGYELRETEDALADMVERLVEEKLRERLGFGNP